MNVGMPKNYQRICKECGILFIGNYNSRYCPKCKEKVSSENRKKYNKSQRRKFNICKTCGEKIPLGQNFCLKCKEKHLDDNILARMTCRQKEIWIMHVEGEKTASISRKLNISHQAISYSIEAINKKLDAKGINLKEKNISYKKRKPEYNPKLFLEYIDADLSILTEREREIFQKYLSGESHKEIAEFFGLTIKSTATRLYSIRRKLDKQESFTDIWRKENKEKLKEYNKKYYQKNKEKILDNKKRWDKENREKVRKINRDYYRRKKLKHKGIDGN